MAGKLDNYESVAERLFKFHQRYPEGIVTTDLIAADEQTVRVKATVYRTPDVPLATGHAEELRGKRGDKVLEKCESTAVGRALALGGFSASKNIASREEMESWNASQARGSTAVAEREHDALDTITDDETEKLEGLVREWLGKDKAKREKLKLKLVSIGVTNPDQSLRAALGQIPDSEKAAELLSWMGQEDSKLTADELADKLIEDGMAVEEAK